MNRYLQLFLFSLAIFPASATLSAQSATATGQGTAEAAQWRQDLADWRAQREQELAAPDGWLTLVSLQWLKPGINSLGSGEGNQLKLAASAPDHVGLITVSGKTVQLLAPNGGFPPDLKIDGNPAREGLLTTEGGKPSMIVWHSLTMLVLERGGRYVLRVKDADAQARTGFHGLNWYAPDPHFRVTASWKPFVPPHVEKIPTVIGTTLDLPAPGIAAFTLNGRALSLEPVLEAGESQTLFFILRDATSKTTTYQAARFLHTGLPDHGLDQPGMLVLDFNRLENPPCAYTPYATCPLPPEQNRLPVPLEAGEERYAH